MGGGPPELLSESSGLAGGTGRSVIPTDMEMDLEGGGGRGAEKGLGGGRGPGSPGTGPRLPGKYGKRRGALRWLRGPAVRVWLVQKLPETSHGVDVGLRRREEGEHPEEWGAGGE